MLRLVIACYLIYLKHLENINFFEKETLFFKKKLYSDEHEVCNLIRVLKNYKNNNK
jgi:hypothetical protein